MSKKIILITFGVACGAWLFGISTEAAMAATLTAVGPALPAAVGQPFEVDIALDAQGADANAIQADVTFPANLFSFDGVVDGGSPVSIWLQAPMETSSGTVSFSGIMPGGFTGQAKSVVGILLTPLASGNGNVDIENAQLLANDGEGTSIPLTINDAAIAVSASASASGTAPSPTTAFTVPNPFTPQIASDPNVYGGKYFLVFSTTDKGSGIDHYDVLEVPAGAKLGSSEPWVTASSPYLLQDQSLSSDIYVRAVNHGGNATIEKIAARHPGNGASRAWTWWLIGAAMLAAAFLIAFAMGRRQRRLRLRRQSQSSRTAGKV